MTSIAIKDLTGKQVGELQLSDYVFGTPVNKAVVHQALIRQLANARSGSANSKTRAEVRGGGRKPWRQKGTGRARAGSIRSPLWAGGGVIFGPKPRDYSLDMNKKARRLAMRSMLSSRTADLSVVTSFDDMAGTHKTKAMVAVLKALGLDDKTVLVILDRRAEGAHQVELSARNLPEVTVIDYNNLNIKDLACADAVLTTEKVVTEIEKKYTTIKGCDAAPCTDELKASSSKAKADPEAKAAKPAAKAPAKKAEPKSADAEPEAKEPKAKKKKTEE